MSNETYLGLTDEDFRKSPLSRYGASALDRMRWYRTSFAFSHVYEPSAKLSLTTTLYRHDFYRVWRKVNGFRGASMFSVMTRPERYDEFVAVLRGGDTGDNGAASLLIGPNQRDFVSQGVDFRARLGATTGALEHRVEYGIRLHQDRIERRHSEDVFVVVGGELVPEGTETTVTVANQDESEALALYAADAITLGALTVTPGVRVEVMHSKSEDELTGAESSRVVHVPIPGIGAYYGLSRSFGVLAGVYRGFSPPAPGSGDAIEPELSVNYEAGARLSDDPLRAEVIGFFNDYSNLTDTCSIASGCLDEHLDRQFDAGQARIYGLEAFFGHELPVGGGAKVPLHLAYTLTFAEFRNSFESQDPIFKPNPDVRPSERVEPGDEIPYVPRHELRASAGVETGSFAANAGITYVSKMREQPGPGSVESGLHTDEQFVVDVSGSAKVWGPASLYANVRNLLDSHDIVSRRPFGARPNAPRWVQVGAKVAF